MSCKPKKCALCGEAFRPNSGIGRYCPACIGRYGGSKACSRKAKRGSVLATEPHFCAACGRGFRPAASNAKYCSDECRAAAACRRVAESRRRKTGEDVSRAAMRKPDVPHITPEQCRAWRERRREEGRERIARLMAKYGPNGTIWRRKGGSEWEVVK